MYGYEELLPPRQVGISTTTCLVCTSRSAHLRIVSVHSLFLPFHACCFSRRPRSLFPEALAARPHRNIAHSKRQIPPRRAKPPTNSTASHEPNSASSTKHTKRTLSKMHFPTLLLTLTLLATPLTAKPLPSGQSLAEIERRWSAGETEVCRPNSPGCYLYAWFHSLRTFCRGSEDEDGVRLQPRTRHLKRSALRMDR